MTGSDKEARNRGLRDRAAVEQSKCNFQKGYNAQSTGAVRVQRLMAWLSLHRRFHESCIVSMLKSLLVVACVATCALALGGLIEEERVIHLSPASFAAFLGDDAFADMATQKVISLMTSRLGGCRAFMSRFWVLQMDGPTWTFLRRSMIARVKKLATLYLEQHGSLCGPHCAGIDTFRGTAGLGGVPNANAYPYFAWIPLFGGASIPGARAQSFAAPCFQNTTVSAVANANGTFTLTVTVSSLPMHTHPLTVSPCRPTSPRRPRATTTTS